MYSVYRLNANELNMNFIKGLKKIFKDKDIEIIISEYNDTEYLLKDPENKNRLLEAISNVDNRKNLVEAEQKVFQ